MARQGHHEEGIRQMRQGLMAQRETGSSVHRVHFLILLAEAHGQAGRCGEGLCLLAEGEAEMEKTDERFYEAELWRLKGKLTLQQENQKSKGKSQKWKKFSPFSVLPLIRYPLSFILFPLFPMYPLLILIISASHRRENQSPLC